MKQKKFPQMILLLLTLVSVFTCGQKQAKVFPFGKTLEGENDVDDGYANVSFAIT